MGYDSINEAVLAQIPSDTHTLLDLGCGGGGMGELLKSRLGCSVVGVTFDEEEAVIARKRVDRVEVHDLNTFEPSVLGKYDCILCSHVLEHLYHPEQLLRSLRNCLNPTGSLVMAIPNILFWPQRLKFMRGQFRYTDGYIMDRTHYRFYDWKCAQELLTDAGYVIRYKGADGGFPLTRFLWGGARRAINGLALHWFPAFYGSQFVFRCQLAEAGPK